MKTKRLRVFAGPNGSGKSTLKQHITGQFSIPFGFFVNADNIESELREKGFFDFAPTGLQLSQTEFADFAQQSSLAERAGQTDWPAQVAVRGSHLVFPKNFEVNSYHAALLADFLREKLLQLGSTFSIETVLSDARKLDFLAKAKQEGYRVYLYFVATDNPEINIGRVKSRVETGGHNVPDEKVRSRYQKALDLLPQVIELTNRAYLFDNTSDLEFVAEITDGADTEFQNGDMPTWVSRLLGL